MMSPITNDQMNALLKTTKAYSLMILKPGPERHKDGVDKIIWEHGRRNLSLRAAGLLSIFCPVAADALNGVGISNLGIEETTKIMYGDPGVREGVFAYEVYLCRSFPGDSLPG